MNIKKWRRACSLCMIGILCFILCLGGCGVRESEDDLVNDRHGTGGVDGQQDVKTADGQREMKLKIVTTIFPLYDWTREVLGGRMENVELLFLLDQGVDLHSYEPTVDDIIQIGTCDIFLYVGGESDTWVEEVLQAAVNPDMKVLNLLDLLGEDVKAEEFVEGMESDHDHGTEENHVTDFYEEDGHAADTDEKERRVAGEQEEDVGREMDEHVWLSLRNARKICNVIADTLGELDVENAATYQQNARSYGRRLGEMDEEFQEIVTTADKQVLLFADRFPFRYLTEDYGLEYYAAFPGCEAETEASFETITFLASKVDELGISCVLTIEGSDGKLADTVVANTKLKSQEILAMDSMQSVNAKKIEEGTTYLSLMEKNKEVLRRALSDE